MNLSEKEIMAEVLDHVKAIENEITGIVNHVFLKPEAVISMTQDYAEKCAAADKETSEHLMDEYNELLTVFEMKPQYERFRELILKIYLRMWYEKTIHMDLIIQHGYFPDSVLDLRDELVYYSGFYEVYEAEETPE